LKVATKQILTKINMLKISICMAHFTQYYRKLLCKFVKYF